MIEILKYLMGRFGSRFNEIQDCEQHHYQAFRVS